MNFNNNFWLKPLILLLCFSIMPNVQSETNALGQKITVINQVKDITGNQANYKYSIWTRIDLKTVGEQDGFIRTD